MSGKKHIDSGKPGGRRGRGALAMAILAAAVIAFCARVWYVNARAQVIPMQAHELGDAVDLDGGFLEYADENTAGYSIRVTGAQVMSPQEYANSYVDGKADVAQGLSELAQGRGAGDADGEASLAKKTEIVLDLEATNTNNENGYLMALSWRVIPQSTKDRAFQPDFSLWALANPAVGGQIGFTIKPGTSMTLHVPFFANVTRPPLKSFDYNYVALVDPGTYNFRLTNVPTRHEINLGYLSLT